MCKIWANLERFLGSNEKKKKYRETDDWWKLPNKRKSIWTQMNKIVKGLKAPSHSGKKWGIRNSPKSNQIKIWGCMWAEKEKKKMMNEWKNKKS